jgi:subtilisin family serine protease
MARVKLGTKDEPAIELKQSEDLIAVRTRSRRSLREEGRVRVPQAEAVTDGELVAAYPEAGVEVYRVPTSGRQRSLDDRKKALRRSTDVRFAGGVLVDGKSGEPVLYTENLFIKFRDDVDPDDCKAVLHGAGLTIKQQLDYATNAYFVSVAEGTGQKVFDIALDLLRRPDVEYCHPELIRRRESKAIAAQQWHLAPTTIAGIAINAHANVASAHALTLGQGVTIAVIDDGVDIDHPEFSSSGKIVAPRDVTVGSDDPRPKSAGNKHGTACAGVACADGVAGASGVAPRARLMPIRLASGLGSIAEANAFKWAADHGADVISCSWGPADGDWFDPSDPFHDQVTVIPASTRLAIEYAISNGRGGKGCVICFAAGNGNEPVENDGYASYSKVLAVAACNDTGRRSVYSDFGEAIWCAFPSSDFGHSPFSHPVPLTPGIWTTDRRASAGYNFGQPGAGDTAGNYANDFGGTSSSCPGAAGVAALVLAVNPDLKWDEVRNILRMACDRIDPAGGAYDGNNHSAKYGHGRLNARTAVELAAQPDKESVAFTRTYNQHLPDLQTTVVELQVTDNEAVQSVRVDLDLQHTYIGDLVITLVPPASTGVGNIVLHSREGGSTRNLKRSYDAATTARLGQLTGKGCKGTWKLRIQDAAAIDDGKLISLGIVLAFPGTDREVVTASARKNGRAGKARSGHGRRRVRTTVEGPAPITVS